jgi:hypothetical protein
MGHLWVAISGAGYVGRGPIAKGRGITTTENLTEDYAENYTDYHQN